MTSIIVFKNALLIDSKGNAANHIKQSSVMAKLIWVGDDSAKQLS